MLPFNSKMTKNDFGKTQDCVSAVLSTLTKFSAMQFFLLF